MNSTSFLMNAEKLGIKAAALSAIKWYPMAVREDGNVVLALLYELSSYYDTITCCKRLKMYAQNRIARGKSSADVTTLIGIIDDIIDNNGNEGRTARSQQAESIQEMYEDGKDIPYIGHKTKNEELIIFDKMICYIKNHNIDFCDAIIDSREAIGQKNRRDIKKHIDAMIDVIGCADLDLHITADMFCKMSQIALHGYLVA